MTDRLSQYRERLLAGVNENLDEGEMAESAVLVQQRARWALPLGIAAGLVVAALAGEGNALLRGGLIGLSIATVLMYGTTFYALARTNKGLILAKTSKWSQNKVLSVERRLSHDAPVETRPGLLTDRLVIEGDRFMMNRQFRTVLTQMTEG